MNELRANTRKPFTLPGVALGAVAVIACSVLAAWAIFRADNTDMASNVAQTGGGHQPTQALLDIYRSLPIPGAATVDQEAVSTGETDLTAVFWVKDEPEAVATFYSLEQVKGGWTLESTERLTTDKKDDGTQFATIRLSFLKDQERLIVSVAPNINYPPLGQTHLGLTLQPR